MRRRRQPLQPSTFPFLAVLLCAMGSLILILLVMDRQARLAARAKAERQARELAERRRAERAEAEQRERESLRLLEARRQEQEAAHARLVREEEALQARRARLEGEVRAAGRALREAEARRGRLGQDLAREKEHLASAKEAWARRQAEREAAGRQAAALREEIAGLTSGIAELEKELAERKSAQARAGRTYSVVPYKGKHGSGRRPVYVECDATGLVFHPDGLALSLTWEPLRILAELEKRTAAAGPGDRPYVLALVRPEGIRHYYPLQAALHELGVDFGYELIDADWVLAFPGEGQPPAEPWAKGDGPGQMVRLSAPRPGSEKMPSRKRPNPGGGEVGERGEVARHSAADVTASPRDAGGQRSGPPTGADEKGRDGVAGHQGDRPFLAAAVPPHPQPLSPGEGGGGKGAKPHAPPGREERSEASRPPGGREGEGNDRPPSVAADVPRPDKGKGNSPWEPARPVEKRPDAEGPPPRPVILPGSEDPGRAGKPRSRRDLLEPVVPGPDVARRPAWLTGERPRTVFVECRSAGAIVYPSRRTFTAEQLRAADNPLLAEVRRLLPADGSRRSRVHFLVWPEGMRTYHDAYPLLDPLDVAKRRRNLQAGDDVGYLIATE